jgi:hypothetical protein
MYPTCMQPPLCMLKVDIMRTPVFLESRRDSRAETKMCGKVLEFEYFNSRMRRERKGSSDDS